VYRKRFEVRRHGGDRLAEAPVDGHETKGNTFSIKE
jgi:hypothetical protein